MSEGAGAGREQPLVRLETVVTATGFCSSVTRLWGGDTLSQPSPTPCGASAPGRSGRGDAGTTPLTVGAGDFAPLAGLGVPASTTRRGWGWGVSAPWSKIWLPRGCSRRSGAPGVAKVGEPWQEEAWKLDPDPATPTATTPTCL